MESILKEILPYAKSFAGLYLIWNVIIGILSIVFIIWTFKFIIKKHNEFDREFKDRWK